MSDESVSVTLEQVSGYEFRVRFEDSAIPDLSTDLSAPLGHDAGPNPERMLTAAVVNCLAASSRTRLTAGCAPRPHRAPVATQTNACGWRTSRCGSSCRGLPPITPALIAS